MLFATSGLSGDSRWANRAKEATDMTMIDTIAERIKVRSPWSIA